MNIIIKDVSIDALKLHPKLEGIKSSINPKQFKKFLPSIKIYGIIEPLKVVRENHSYFIVDGYVRYQTLVINKVEIETVRVEEISLIDADVILDSLLRNTRIKRSYKEIAHSAHYFLNLIGSSQGKKRIDLGPIDSVDDFGEVSKDRFLLACTILSLDLSPKTLRRLVKIYEIDQTPEGSKLKLFDLLESGKRILPVYKIAIETDESRTIKKNRSIELQSEKEDKIKQAGSIKEYELKYSIRSEFEEKFQKEYEERYEKEFGTKPKPKSLLDMEWDGKINKLQQIRIRLSVADEEIINELLKRY